MFANNISRDHSLRRRLSDVYARRIDPLVGGRPLPEVLILGAQKAGTTTLFHALAQHPQTQPSRTKEVHFFDQNYSLGLDWYRYHFPRLRPSDEKALRFESSPYYLFHPCVPRRVRQHLPAARFIVLLRDPVARAYSHYWHERSRGREPLSFAEAVAAESKRVGDAEQRLLCGDLVYSRAHHRHAYVARGHYAAQLRRWYELFPPERFLVLESEAFFEAPERELARVADFLGLAPFGRIDVERRNIGTYQSGIDPHLAAELSAEFTKANRGLAELAGHSFRWQPD